MTEDVYKRQGLYIPKVAHVYCQGTQDHTKKRYEYTGTLHCASAHGLYSGPNSCTYGCLGFGDCVNVCEFNALYIENGIAHVNHENCTACGKCVDACPKHLIHMIPKHEAATVCTCSNHWPGAVTRKDVYKRQVDGFAATHDGEPIVLLVALDIEGTVQNVLVVSHEETERYGGRALDEDPVSYTHLDVYKRQAVT